jgi:Uncharacterized protein conserved in bacteria (DUF2213)
MTTTGGVQSLLKYLKFELSSIEVVPETGYLRCSGVAARTGVQSYDLSELPEDCQYLANIIKGNRVGIYRGASFLLEMSAYFNQGDRPLMDEHHFVENANNGDKRLGWITSASVVDKANGEAYLIVNFIVDDPDTIKQLLKAKEDKVGHIGLSVGYFQTILKLKDPKTWVDVDGILGSKDEAYWYYLTASTPVVNHLAKCQLGRAGLSTQVYLDSEREQVAGMVDLKVGDSPKLYPYPDSKDDIKDPNPDEETKMTDMTRDEMRDAMKSCMKDLLKDPEYTDSLGSALGLTKNTVYGGVSAPDLIAAIRQMYEGRDKVGIDPEDQSIQKLIQSKALEKGFINDSIEGEAVKETTKPDIAHLVSDSLVVWKDLGAEAITLPGIQDSSTGMELRRAWLTQQGLGSLAADSIPEETVKQCYDELRAISKAGTLKQEPPTETSKIKQFFKDSLSPTAPNQGSNATDSVDGFTEVGSTMWDISLD